YAGRCPDCLSIRSENDDQPDSDESVRQKVLREDWCRLVRTSELLWRTASLHAFAEQEILEEGSVGNGGKTGKEKRPHMRAFYIWQSGRGSPTFRRPPIRKHANRFDPRRKPRRRLAPFRDVDCLQHQ